MTCGIIGGGPSGIGIAKCLAQRGLPFEILEREDDFGGVWYFGSGSGRVYRSTHLISSKLNTQFSDYPMPADYPPYPSHAQFLRYLRDLARHAGLYERTRFGTAVTRVERDGDDWLVTSGDGAVRRYEALLVATGLQREPVTPDYPGPFHGESFHAADYRDADVFRDKRLLVIGGGNSGCDIAVDAVRTASAVFHSTRRAYYYLPKFVAGQPTQEWLMALPARFPERDALWSHVAEVLKLASVWPSDFGLPLPDYSLDQAHPIMNSQFLYHVGHGDIVPKGDVASFEGARVRFTDGRAEEIDSVVYATGYRPMFPFLDASYVSWRGHRPDLFLHVFHRRFDNLFFLGLVNAAAGFGNVANALGQLLGSYLDARRARSAAFDAFRRLARDAEPDLGQDRFIRSPRHEYEVDLWKLIRALNFFRTKLEAAA